MAQAKTTAQEGLPLSESVANPLLLDIIDNESVDESIVRDYIKNMEKNFETMDSEKTWDAVLTNLEILDVLLTDNADINLLQDFLSTIFITFRDLLVDSTSKKTLGMHEILFFSFNNLDETTKTQQRAYLQIKANLLRIYTRDLDSIKSQYKEITQAFDHNSEFYQLFTRSSVENDELAYILSYSFIRLSLSTKTAYKLIFLIFATHYSLFTNNIKLELFEKLVKDGEQMLHKSETLIYKVVSPHLFALSKTAEVRGNHAHLLNNLVESFKKVEKCKPLIRASKNHLSSKDLLLPLENMNISENLITFLHTYDSRELLDSPGFIKQLLPIIKNFDINDHYLRETFTEIIDLSVSDVEKYQNVSRILDFIIFRFKDFKCTPKNVDFVHSSLKKLSEFLMRTRQKKQLGNLTRLLFYFATSILVFDPLKSLPLWTLFIECNNIFDNSMNFKLTVSKRLNYITNEQVLKSNYEIAMSIQLIFLNTTLVNRNIFSYESLLEEFSSSIKQITNCIFNEIRCGDILFKYIEDESLLIALVLRVIKNLQIGNAMAKKTSLISQIIILQKENISDSGLFLYFLSRTSMMIDFPINFKNSSLNFTSDSVIYMMEKLVVPHLYILQSYSNSRYNPEFLVKCYDMITIWINTTECNYSEYEFEVITTLYHTLQYNNFHTYGFKMLKSFLEKRVGPQDVKHRKQISSLMINSLVFLEDFTTCENLIMQCERICDADSIKCNEDVNLALAMLLYSSKFNDSRDTERIKKLYATFKNDERFSVQNQRDRYKAVELLLLHSKFCSILSSCTKSSHFDSISNLNRSMSILQSVFKNFLLPTAQTPSLNVNFKSVLKMRFSQEMLFCYNSMLKRFSILGLGKEFDHYLKELEIFVEVQPSFNLQYYFSLKLMDFNTFKGAINKASNYSEYLTSIADDSYFEKNDLSEIYRLTIIENYARKTGNLKTIKETSFELDNILINYLKSHDLSSSLLSQLVTILWRRYENTCEFGSGDSQLVARAELGSRLGMDIQYNLLKSLTHTLMNNSNSVCYYPVMCTSSPSGSPKGNACTLQNLNMNLIKYFENNFETSTVEISKNQLHMIINCFAMMVSCDENMKASKEMSQVVSLTDGFKYHPFEIEKEFALNSSKQNCLLPVIPEHARKEFTLKSRDINLKSVLPDDWQVISIDYVNSTKSLAIVKYDYKYDDPFFINISLKRTGQENSFEAALESLKDIIQQSDITTSTEVTSKINTYQEKFKWWETRKKLDRKLEKLLSQIDAEWFGGFNSLFQQSVISVEEIKSFKEDLIELVIATAASKEIDHKDLYKALTSIHAGIYELFLKIDGMTVEKVLQLLNFLLEVGSLGNITFSENEILDMAQTLEGKVITIKKKTIIHDSSIFHTVLVPGSSCTQIPWESIPSLRVKSITRMPTLTQLENYLIRYKSLMNDGIDACKGYYVINPGGDLKRTESNLSPRFANLDGWDGLIGKVPNDSDILKAFDERNLYIYAGHGGGEQYIKSKHIKQRSYIPPSLLLGCSSGLLKGGGSIHRYGTAYNYMNGGCPMLLVNMWDVTDKDIDLFTISALTKWGFFVDYDSFDPFDISTENSTISLCVAQARNVCKLKYLNGAAPIVYGLPLRLETI